MVLLRFWLHFSRFKHYLLPGPSFFNSQHSNAPGLSLYNSHLVIIIHSFLELSRMIVSANYMFLIQIFVTHHHLRKQEKRAKHYAAWHSTRAIRSKWGSEWSRSYESSPLNSITWVQEPRAYPECLETRALHKTWKWPFDCTVLLLLLLTLFHFLSLVYSFLPHQYCLSMQK